ncbi:hypothetical protein NWP17_16830 [Chrysosporum bergii ANA360D]|uniref:Outer membrane protein beta-barrel domain-containing protein n=1 Tax=Chrysosporum bergii ANA360D TaxID=617107 RepID=A0AA43GUQ7_9CYAN|nr:hypothetical protein [Chrysosporum bergii]MDH6062078.1 hypothetical protein [Chrysosporum bergii ANA360D]
MNVNIFPVFDTLRQRNSWFYLPALAALTVLSGGLPAVAETAHTHLLAGSSVNATSVDTILLQQFPQAHNQQVADAALTPIPGTAITSSAALTSESKPTAQFFPTQVAQADIVFGGATRGGGSYIGVAGNIGLGGGDSSLGDGNFAVISKVGVTNTISLRPSAVFGNNTTILIPVTYDFKLQQPDPFDEPLAFAPYVGVGAAIKTGDDSKTALLVSGGVDFPLNAQFTATASLNAGFFDDTDVGLLLGVGYNFSGF